MLRDGKCRIVLATRKSSLFLELQLNINMSRAIGKHILFPLKLFLFQRIQPTILYNVLCII